MESASLYLVLDSTVLKAGRIAAECDSWSVRGHLDASLSDGRLRASQHNFSSRRFFAPSCVVRLPFRFVTAMLNLPIWFLTQERNAEPQSWHAPCDESGAVIAFSTTEKLTAFLANRQSGEWKVSLVSDRAGLVFIVALAHNSGLESICFDLGPDGSGGEQIFLNELMSLANSVK